MRRDDIVSLRLVSARASLALAQDIACELRWSAAGRAAIRAHAEAAIADLRAVVERLGGEVMDVGERDPWDLSGRRVA